MKQLFVLSQESIAAKYGIGTYIQQLIGCFEQSEWRIHVVELRSSVPNYGILEEDGISYYKIPLPKKIQSLWSNKIEYLYCKSVFYLLATNVAPQDEVYCHFNFTQGYELAMLFKERLHAKIILTLHYMNWSFDLLGDCSWLRRILAHPMGTKDNGVVWRFESEKKFMLECCDRIIAIAHHSYETLHTLYGILKERLVYIPNALKDVYRFRSEDERAKLKDKYHFGRNEKLILFVGRLDLVKGVIKLLEAFDLLQAEIPETRLIIAGDGDYKRCFEAAYPCWSKVTFTGFVNKEQLSELYAITDVGCVPSLHEEFGYVAVEMMMNKLPVIVSNTTGLKEIVNGGEYGALVDITNEKGMVELARVLNEWLSNRSAEYFRELGRLRFEQEYSFGLFANRMKLLYHDI